MAGVTWKMAVLVVVLVIFTILEFQIVEAQTCGGYVCSTHAYCYSSFTRTNYCRCRSGYHGDALTGSGHSGCRKRKLRAWKIIVAVIGSVIGAGLLLCLCVACLCRSVLTRRKKRGPVAEQGYTQQQGAATGAYETKNQLQGGTTGAYETKNQLQGGTTGAYETNNQQQGGTTSAYETNNQQQGYTQQQSVPTSAYETKNQLQGGTTGAYEMNNQQQGYTQQESVPTSAFETNNQQGSRHSYTTHTTYTQQPMTTYETTYEQKGPEQAAMM